MASSVKKETCRWELGWFAEGSGRGLTEHAVVMGAGCKNLIC